jgi:tRNA pseudouridine55 synthase
MDGVLLIDKPSGPTSHDVVARLRAVSGERSIGHTGTLDPLATGLLPLVLGKATRLSPYLTGRDKTYEAIVRFGFATDTDDAAGQPLGAASNDLPDESRIAEVLKQFEGEIQQMPPRHSAKKIGGHKAYDLARRDEPVALESVPVTVRAIACTGREGDRAHVTVTASSGFYVRALARDLGQALGCGAHLAALRRTRSGRFGIEDAMPLADAERLGRAIADRLITPADALGDLPAVTVTQAGRKRAQHGNPLGPEHLAGRWLPPVAGGPNPAPVRILDENGSLLALAHSRGGSLHPAVVLG